MTFDRAAEFVRPRLVYGLLAGGLVWAVWLFGCAFSQSDWRAGQLVFGFSDSDGLGTLVAVDHLAFYAPARSFLEGRGGEIYDPAIVAAYEQELIPSGVFRGLELMRNPPFFALLFTPTAHLDYVTSMWIWAAVSVLAGVGAAWLLAQDRPGRVALWVLLFFPCHTAVTYGQNGILSLAVFAAVYRLLARGYLTGGGLLASLLWFKPPLLFGLMVWWALDWRRYWPAGVGLIAGGALILALTLPLIPEAWLAFISTLGMNAEFDSFDWWKAHSARAFWRLLLSPDAAPVPLLLWVACVGAGAVWFYRIWAANRASVAIPFAAAVLFTQFASPHVMIYDWAVVLVSAILVWQHAPAHRTRWFVIFAVGWVAFFVSTEFAHAQDALLERLTGQPDPPGVIQVSQLAVAWAMLVSLPALAPRRSAPDNTAPAPLPRPI